MKNAEIAERFKIRCSGISSIMAGSIGLTVKQEIELDKLVTRVRDTNAKPLTDVMSKRMEELVNIDAKPILPDGAKTFCLNWLSEQPEFFNRRNEFSSKYTDKGNKVEQDVLNMVASHLNYGMLLKNEEWFEGDFATGTPDNIQEDHVIDVKASWDFSTFPIFDTEPDKRYWWQGQGYMFLTGKPKYKLIYGLADTPAGLIDREVHIQANALGLDEDEKIVLYEFLQKKMTYDDLPLERKVKVFEFNRDDEAVKSIEARVVMCRDFILQTLNSIEASN